MARRTRASIVVMFLGGLAGAVRGQGSALCSLDDVNGDGVRELAVASREQGQPEQVWVLSGKDGSVLRSWKSDAEFEGFGAQLAAVGDLDGDGAEELAVGVPGGALRLEHPPLTWMWKSNGTCRVVLYSPKRGTLVRTCALKPTSWTTTTCIARAGDWNGDGASDLCVGSGAMQSGRGGCLKVLSGKDAAPLIDFGAPRPGSAVGFVFPNALLALDDVDSDGVTDFALGVPDLSRAQVATAERPASIGGGTGSAKDKSLEEPRGGVLVISGRTGVRITAALGDEPDDELGDTLVRLADLDGDGRPEFAIGARSRYVRIVSLANETRELRVLRTIESHSGRSYVDDFGSSIDTVPDLDGDGMTELLVGANELFPPGAFDEGYAEIWSTASGKRITLLESSRTQGIDASRLDDVNGDGVPEVALSLLTCAPEESWHTNQLVRVVNAKEGKKVVWERTIASLRAAPAPQPK